jgi:hypothetical protein
MPLYKSDHPLVVEAIDRSVYPWVILSDAVVTPKFDSPVPGVKKGNARHNKIASTIRLMTKLLMQRPTEQFVQVWALMDRSSTSIRSGTFFSFDLCVTVLCETQ